MSNSKEHVHIKTLHEQRAKNDKNSSTLAQTLETTIFTPFKSDHKFIFELLQNADDASDRKETEANIILKRSLNNRDYLIFSHSGRHFTEQDVEKICDNSQQHFQDKLISTKKIGYKGIGFKSVFSIADCVHIISDNYNFRFDQNYFSEKNKGGFSYPWPIIPIQNDESSLMPDIKSFVRKEHVTFILQIRSGMRIESEMQFIKENRNLMLFLKNVSKISLLDNLSSTNISVQAVGNVKKFFINNLFVDSWLMEEVVFDIPQEASEFLKSLQDSECPQRLKAAVQTKIIFSAQITTEDKIIPIAKGQPFCYLPTQVNCGFPFFVNADFLLNSERSRIIDNRWNAFLMSYVGYGQLMFLAELTKHEEYHSQIFKLLHEQYSGPLIY